jgi:hypothetical protein
VSHLLPANHVTVFSHYGAMVITNATPSRIELKHQPKEIELLIHSDGSVELSDVSPHFNAYRLCHMGIFDPKCKGEKMEPGKFVYLEDGTFFLFHQMATHKDVTYHSLTGLDNKDCEPKSAGFFVIEGDKIDLYGDSFSLGSIKPMGDKSDRRFIMDHLQRVINPNQQELFAEAVALRD